MVHQRKVNRSYIFKWIERLFIHMAIDINENGVTVPEPFQNADKIVIRTPTQTIDIPEGFLSMSTDGKFPIITPDTYQGLKECEEDTMENPELCPDKISFKEYGEEAEVFTVECE